MNANDDFDDAKEPALQLAIKTKYVHLFLDSLLAFMMFSTLFKNIIFNVPFYKMDKNASNVLSP